MKKSRSEQNCTYQWSDDLYHELTHDGKAFEVGGWGGAEKKNDGGEKKAGEVKGEEKNVASSELSEAATTATEAPIVQTQTSPSEVKTET